MNQVTGAIRPCLSLVDLIIKISLICYLSLLSVDVFFASRSQTGKGTWTGL